MVSNGTAVLGLGNIGPLAAKPVMEGKAVLFKKFAGIDVFDIEIDAHEVDRVVDVVAALEPTFGGINLEDFKAPECFEIEAKLKERMKIPVFHDDQHGTAIIVAAAVRNALELAGQAHRGGQDRCRPARARPRSPASTSWSRSARRRENIWVTDIEGVVYEGRPQLMDRWKSVYAQKTDKRTLGEVIDGRRHLPRPVRRRRAQARHGQAHGGAPADHGARQPDARRSCRRRRWRRGPTP